LLFFYNILAADLQIHKNKFSMFIFNTLGCLFSQPTARGASIITIIITWSLGPFYAKYTCGGSREVAIRWNWK